MCNKLRKRKPIVYISLAIYLLLLSFIIVESTLSGGFTSDQSKWFANISAWIVNVFNGPQIPDSINPTEFGTITDSTYLGKGKDGIPNIAIGTTTLVSIPVNYPTKPKDYDVYNFEYNVNYTLGNKNHFNTVQSSRVVNKTSYVIDLRIVANEMGDDLYQIDLNVADTLSYTYKFHITELATPTNYEAKINKTNLKTGETAQISAKLLDEKRNDAYLRRYFDESKINRSSSDENVATIDRFGVVHGISAGVATITYGTYTFDITVSNETIIKPATNSISLEIKDGSKTNPSLLDYDYVFEDGEISNDYSTLIYPTFEDTSLEDQSFSYEISDNLKTKITPYRYDENGYPVYHDDEGKSCVRLCGYRKKGEVTLTCYSNSDNEIKQTISLNVDEALPTSMKISVANGKKLLVNEQLVISATFGPKNVNNKKIHISVDNTDLIKITNNDTASVTIKALAMGNVKITATSVANPSLVQEFNLELTANQVINDDNYTDFHIFIRKASGHFLLFLATAVFGMIFFYTFIDDDKRLWLSVALSLSIGLLAAGASELIQYFVPSRTGSMSDVSIDFIGYLIGTAISFGVMMFIRYFENRKKE